MRKLQLVLLIFLSALVGFSIHDYARDLGLKWFSRTPFIPSDSSAANVLGQSSSEKFMTTISYDGKTFYPNYSSIQAGNYLLIINKSKTALMWLSSDIPGVSTSRGYAEGEQLQYAVKQIGTFSIHDRLNPDARATVVVNK